MNCETAKAVPFNAWQLWLCAEMDRLRIDILTAVTFDGMGA